MRALAAEPSCLLFVVGGGDVLSLYLQNLESLYHLLLLLLLLLRKRKKMRKKMMVTLVVIGNLRLPRNLLSAVQVYGVLSLMFSKRP